MGSRYQRRASEMVRQHLTDLVKTRINDPRIEFVTITGVDVNPDVSQAQVYVMVLGDESARADALAGLQSAAGFLRRELGQRIRLRNTPELTFCWDSSFERGERITDLLDQLKDDLDVPTDSE